MRDITIPRVYCRRQRHSFERTCHDCVECSPPLRHRSWSSSRRARPHRRRGRPQKVRARHGRRRRGQAAQGPDGQGLHRQGGRRETGGRRRAAGRRSAVDRAADRHDAAADGRHPADAGSAHVGRRRSSRPSRRSTPTRRSPGRVRRRRGDEPWTSPASVADLEKAIAPALSEPADDAPCCSRRWSTPASTWASSRRRAAPSSRVDFNSPEAAPSAR